MKPNRSINWIRVALLCLALALVFIVLTIPLLAKGISQIVGNTIEPEKLDIRPVPVPVPPLPLVIGNRPISATPSPLLDRPSALQPIAVPIAPVSGTAGAATLLERQMPESTYAMTVQIASRQEIIAMTLMFVGLLIWVWLHRIPGFHSLKRRSAS